MQMHHTTIISLFITQREQIKTPGLTSRYFRPTAHGTQATNQRSKYIMLITFFTHLDGKRAHLWTRHLDQNRLTLPFLFTLPRFSAFNSKTRSRHPRFPPRRRTTPDCKQRVRKTAATVASANPTPRQKTATQLLLFRPPNQAWRRWRNGHLRLKTPSLTDPITTEPGAGGTTATCTLLPLRAQNGIETAEKTEMRALKIKAKTPLPLTAKAIRPGNPNTTARTIR